MKRALLNIIYLSIFCLLFAGCDKDENSMNKERIDVTPSVMNFKAQRDTVFFEIKRFSSSGIEQSLPLPLLQITIPEDWCYFYYSSNVGQPRFITKPNSNNIERSQIINIRDEINGLETNVQVKQSAAKDASYITFSRDFIDIPTGMNSASFSIKSDGAWHITNLPDWCKLETKEGNGDQYFFILTSNSNEGRSKEGEIIFSYGGQKSSFFIRKWTNEDAFINLSSNVSLQEVLTQNKLFSTIKRIKINGIASGTDYITLQKIVNLREVDVSELMMYDGTLAIPSFAFMNCSFLEKVSFPKNLKVIGDNAFNNCKTISEIEIPEGVVNINVMAFLQCSSLVKVQLPHTLKIIGDLSFIHSNLTEVRCKAEEPPYIDEQTFNRSTLNSAILYVPIDSKAKYQSHKYWGKFENIKEIN